MKELEPKRPRCWPNQPERKEMLQPYSQAINAAIPTGVGGGIEKRMPEVRSQAASLEPNIKHLFDLVSTLEARLSESVLQDNPPETDGDTQGRAITSTRLGLTLEEANYSLILLAIRLNSLLNRLEV